MSGVYGGDSLEYERLRELGVVEPALPVPELTDAIFEQVIKSVEAPPFDEC